MKRILKKAGILLLVFLLGTAGTALLLNSESTDNRSDFNDNSGPDWHMGNEKKYHSMGRGDPGK